MIFLFSFAFFSWVSARIWELSWNFAWSLIIISDYNFFLIIWVKLSKIGKVEKLLYSGKLKDSNHSTHDFLLQNLTVEKIFSRQYTHRGVKTSQSILIVFVAHRWHSNDRKTWSDRWRMAHAKQTLELTHDRFKWKQQSKNLNLFEFL